jgi:O-antigen/teichoic acid export membrane protein
MLQKFSVGSVAIFSMSKLAGYLAVTHYFEFNLQAAILADTIAYAMSYVLLAAAHLRHCRVRESEREYSPDPQERRRLFRYGVASHFNEASSLMLYSQTDNFFVAALMNPLAVGAYSFFTRINEMVVNLIPTRLFENVVQPVIYATPREQAPEKLPRYFTFLVNISMIAQWPIIMMSLVYHRELIELAFGGKFIEYSLLLPIVLAFAWSDNVPSLPVTMLALHAENASLILKSQLFGLYQIAAMLVLIPLMGLYGAAIATGTLHLFRNLWVWWKMRQTARWLNFGAAMRNGFAIWGGAALTCFLLKAVVPLPSIAQVAMGVLVCGAGVLLFVRSGAIAQSDREILANLMHGRESALLNRLGLAPRAALAPGGTLP